MTSARRTNLFRIKANEAVQLPLLSVGLTDLSKSTIDAYAEVQGGFRIVGNGTFRPSFGEGSFDQNLPHTRSLSIVLLHGYPNRIYAYPRSYHHQRCSRFS